LPSLPATFSLKGNIMRLVHGFAFAAALVMLVPGVMSAQNPTEGASRAVAGGGISVPGWSGKIDASEEKAGRTLNDAKLAKDGDALHVTPAITRSRRHLMSRNT
jgi:hypothetical protein